LYFCQKAGDRRNTDVIINPKLDFTTLELWAKQSGVRPLSEKNTAKNPPWADGYQLLNLKQKRLSSGQLVVLGLVLAYWLLPGLVSDSLAQPWVGGKLIKSCLKIANLDIWAQSA